MTLAVSRRDSSTSLGEVGENSRIFPRMRDTSWWTVNEESLIVEVASESYFDNLCDNNNCE